MIESLLLDYSLVRNFADIFLVAYLIYRGLLLVRGTRSAPMLAGLFLVVLFYFISRFLGLLTLSWILGNLLDSIILLVVVIFQDEIRRALTKFGLQPLFRKTVHAEVDNVIEDVTLAATKLAKAKLGALIVLQRNIGLENFIDDSIVLDAQLNRKLLYTIFVRDSPLHDGAVVIVGDRILAAGCVLPLSYNPDLDPNLGTRHRAALGLSEKSDAITVVVSEETSAISVAQEGTLYRNLDANSLREILEKAMDLDDVHIKDVNISDAGERAK
jgi:diadenylate cyclase